DEVNFNGIEFQVGFNRNNGMISYLAYRNHQMLEGLGKGLKLNIYRATLDNVRDKDWGQEIPWEKEGYDSLSFKVNDFNINQSSRKSVQVTASVIASTKSGYEIPLNLVYTVYGNGNIQVSAFINPNKGGLPLARLGF